jgi:CRP/FNR family transcriptional regulator
MKNETCSVCSSKSEAAQKLSSDEIRVLENNCARVKFQSGDIIIKQDSFSTNVAYIKSGLVKIHVKGPMRERIMKITKAPRYLCLPGSFGDKTNHFSVTALEETIVCFIDFNVFKQFIYMNGDFAYQIILDMSKSELQNFSNCLNNAQKQNIGRVADAILFFADKIYGSNSFDLPVSRQEIADLTGITRESASRIFSEFHNERIIDLQNRHLTILNEKLLKEISEKG